MRHQKSLQRFVAILAVIVLSFAACSRGDGTAGLEPVAGTTACDVVSLDDVASLFGASSGSISDDPPGECRYGLDDGIASEVRLVRYDPDGWEGVRRTYESFGDTLTPVESMPDHALTVGDGHELLVHTDELVLSLSTSGTDQRSRNALLALASQIVESLDAGVGTDPVR